MRLDSSNLPPNFSAAAQRPPALRHSPDCQCPVCRKAYDHIPTPQIPDAKPSQQAGALEQDREGEAQGPRRPVVRFTLRRVRLLDVDAKWGSVKDLLDGVVTSGLVRGDREDQIILEVTQEKVATFKEEETLIAIKNPDGPATHPAQAPGLAPAKT